jgi:EAL domain-containing protein (putative c-di-GMP-specific phosphodiesterase class I)/ActR/RegA family two-component response regulator
MGKRDQMNLPRILFVEEDDLLCRLITWELESRGYPVVCITRMRDSRAALAFRPNVMIVDLAVAWTDDYRLIRTLAALPTPGAVIFARENAPHSSLRTAIEVARESGVEVLGTIDKPYLTDALLPLIARYNGPVESGADGDREFLRQLIADDRLIDNVTVEFQTKQCLKTNRVIGYEALARVRNRRALNPELLFSDDIELPLQFAMTDVVLDLTMGFWKALERDGRSQSVSINCSSAMLSDPDFVQNNLIAAIRSHRVPFREVIIELTDVGETGLEALKEGAERLAATGIRISIDDFGRDIRDYDRISELPFKELKLDKTLFWTCAQSKMPPLPLRELIAYCEAGRINVVVEGIETAKHRAVAKLLGAHQGQGFFWGRAMPPQFYVTFDEIAYRSRPH